MAVGSNNFLPFNPNMTNMVDDTTYLNGSYRLNGVVSGIALANYHNKLFYQTSTMCSALAQVLANRGNNVLDSDVAGLIVSLSKLIGVSNGVVDAQNLKISNVANGTSNSDVVNLGQFGGLFTANGYQKLPSGLIIQWGYYTCAAVNTAYASNFPMVFPNGCLGIVGTMGNLGNAVTSAVNIGFLSATQYRVSCATTDVVHWIAVGC